MLRIKRSILVHIFFLIVAVALFLVSTNFILPKKHISAKQDYLIKLYKGINKMSVEEYENIMIEFKNKNKLDITCLIYDKDNNVIYDTRPFPPPSNLPPVVLKGEPPVTSEKLPLKPPLDIKKVEIINRELKLIWGRDKINGLKVLVLAGKLKNGYYIDLSTIVLDKTISLFNYNRLIISFSLFLIGVGIISVHYYQRKNARFKLTREVSFNGSKNTNGPNSSCMVSSQRVNDRVAISSENEKLNKKQKEILSNVTHELKTPLTLMQGYAEGLKYSIKNDEDKAELFSQIIINETKKMSDLVESILDLNMIESENITLNRTEFLINNKLITLLKKFDIMIKSKEINLKTHFTHEATVYADEEKFEQIFYNLISNAIKYVNEEKLISVKTERVNNSIRVSFFNSTTGITDDDIAKMWDSFFTNGFSNIKGHGLGLSIVKAIMEMEGKMCGAYLEGNGIVFYFDIGMKK